MWVTGSGNNDVQFGKGANADLKIYNLDLTPYGYDVKVENGTWAETYDVLISTIKSCTDSANRYVLMHIAEDMLMPASRCARWSNRPPYGCSGRCSIPGWSGSW